MGQIHKKYWIKIVHGASSILIIRKALKITIRILDVAWIARSLIEMAAQVSILRLAKMLCKTKKIN